MRLLRTKPLEVYDDEYKNAELTPCFGFWSLLAIGIGGCVGSGVFVLAGEVARTTAGPATAVSWLLAGCICFTTATSYSELAALLKGAGSAYAFSYYGLGEIFASIAAYLVTLEYGISGAAVARNWGDKVAYWFDSHGWVNCTEYCWLNSVGGSSFNPMAMVISSLIVGLLLSGVKIEKCVLDVMVIIKMCTVAFVIVTGFVYADWSNLTPYLPPPGVAHDGSSLNDFKGGIQSIFIAATATFLGFVGFDEVTAMAGEAINPRKDIPRAMFISIATVTIISFIATTVLTAMVPYDTIDKSEGFGKAFEDVGASWAKEITVISELLVILPAVVLVSYMPQARTFHVMAKDGQLPAIFKSVNKKTNSLFWGTLICGTSCTIICAVVPFKNLNDLITGGILLSFVLTNSSLLITRSKRKAGIPVLAMSTSMMICSFLFNKTDLTKAVSIVSTSLFGVVSLALVVFLAVRYDFKVDYDSYQTPFVPYLPSCSIFLNCFLIAQLSWLGVGTVIGLICVSIITYFAYGYHRTVDYSLLKNKDLEKKLSMNLDCDSDSMK